MITRREVLLGTAAAAVAPLAGCRRKDGEEKKLAGVKVGLLMPEVASPHSQAVRQKLQEAAQKAGAELLIEDAQGKPSEQVRALEQFLQQEVGAILVHPVEPKKLAPALEKASAANVPVVSFDREIPGADVAAHVDYNQELAGELAGDFLANRLSGGGRVAVVREAGAADQEQQVRAFRAYLKQEQPSIQVAREVTVPDEASQRAAIDRLLAEGKLDAVYALNDSLALAAAEAVRGRGEGPLIIGYGGSPATMAELKKPESPLTLVLSRRPTNLANRAFKLVARVLSNQKTAAALRLPVQPVTRENVAAYPGWDQQMAETFEIPWPSDLEVKVKREE